MRNQYFTFTDINSIMFAEGWNPLKDRGSANPVNKIRKNINVKGYVRKGKFVRSFKREQNVKEKVVRVAAISLGVLGAALGVGIASAAMTKVRYNKNLVDFGNKIKDGTDSIADMKIPSSVKRVKIPQKTTKDSMTFFIGGLGKFEDAQGDKLMRQVKLAYKNQNINIEKNNELIPLFHSHQLKKEGNLSLGQAVVDTFENAAIKGYNEDSIIMAKEIYKWHKLNPDKPLKIITNSAGGFQGRDIPHILESAGVDTKKLMKVFSIATPDYGLVDEIVPTLKVMHSDDFYAKTIPSITKASIPSLHRGTVFLGKGDTPRFREMRAKTEMLKAPYKTVKRNGKFVSGKEYNPPSKFQENFTMPMALHYSPAYLNGETPTSRKALHYLKKFMFED